MDLNDELRGSDEVEHNICERLDVVESKHVLGKRVEHKKNDGEAIPIKIIKNPTTVET